VEVQQIINHIHLVLTPIINSICTFSTSFHFDYVLLHKTSINITISYQRLLISSHNKTILIIESIQHN
jgi:hypothetical protein